MRDCRDCIFRRPDFDCKYKHDCWIKEKKFNDGKLHALVCERYTQKEAIDESKKK